MLSGRYSLSNLPDAGSELALNPDGTFDFSIAYGAADYEAHGSWRVDGGAVILDSSADPAQAPFRLVRSAASRIPGARIWVASPQGGPVPHVDVRIETPAGPADDRTDDDGVAFFPQAHAAQSASFRIRAYRFESEPVTLDPAHN